MRKLELYANCKMFLSGSCLANDKTVVDLPEPATARTNILYHSLTLSIIFCCSPDGSCIHYTKGYIIFN